MPCGHPRTQGPPRRQRSLRVERVPESQRWFYWLRTLREALGADSPTELWRRLVVEGVVVVAAGRRSADVHLVDVERDDPLCGIRPAVLRGRGWVVLPRTTAISCPRCLCLASLRGPFMNLFP